jgi:hypothetical protein
MIRTIAILALVLMIAVAFARTAPAAGPVRRQPSPATEPPPALPSAVVPPIQPLRTAPDDDIDRLLDSTASPELVAKLHDDPPDAVALAAIIALGRTGNPAALPALQAEVVPSRPFRAAMALQSIHQIERGDLAGRLADELLRSPDLANADPVYHAAAVVKGLRIDDVVGELVECGAGTVRDQAATWMQQRRLYMNVPPCGKEHP